MGKWFFIPWTIQYLIGAVIASTITLSIFIRYRKSWAYRVFLGFGLCIFLTCIMIFLHRNAPSKELSALFYRIDLFFGSLLNPLTFLMILFLWQEKIIFTISILPGAFLACYALIFSPFEIVSISQGWSYVFETSFNIFFIINMIGYIILCLISLIYLIQKIPLKALKEKFKIIITGLLTCTIGAVITNTIMQISPEFPPFAGVWIVVQFIFIAIALSLKEEKTKFKLEDVYARFLSRLFKVIPGKEFGQNLIEFANYIQFTGLNNIITISGDSYVFDKIDFYKINLVEVLEKNIQYLEIRGYRSKAFNEFRDLFLYVFMFINFRSKPKTDTTFIRIIKDYEKFLLESNALYNLGYARFLKIITVDNTLAGMKDNEVLIGFYERLRLAINMYSKRLLGDIYQEIPEMSKYCKKTYTSVYTEYNLILYDRYNYVHGKTAGFKEGFIDLTTQVIRLHMSMTKDLPVIPVFFFERILNDFYSSFSGNITKLSIQKLSGNMIRKDSTLRHLKISGNKIFFPCFDECICRNRLISMCKVFVKYLVDKFTEKSLRQFLDIMLRFSIPEAEVIIDRGKVYVIKENDNLGYLLLNSYTDLKYSTMYIGKKVDGLSLHSGTVITIEKKPLLEEVNHNNQISFNNLNGLLKSIRKFIKVNKNTVIMVNSLDDILYINSFNNTINLLHAIDKIIKKENARVIMLGNLLTLNESEERAIEQDFHLLNKSNLFYSTK